MPDAIRTTVESFGARPQRSGFRAALFLSFLPCCHSAWAEQGASRQPISTLEAYIAAFALLDRHEIAALALTLGILCFAVVTAILLVRTRRRLSELESAARDETMATKAAIDRAYALLLCEPQILVIWAAAGDPPEIIGDPALVTARRAQSTAGPAIEQFRRSDRGGGALASLPCSTPRDSHRCSSSTRTRRSTSTSASSGWSYTPTPIWASGSF